jgi:Fe-S-cluster containining protein
VNENTNKECRRCGNCCFVDMIAYVTDADIQRWGREQRFDIIERIKGNDIIWSGDTLISSKGMHLQSCIYLNWNGDVFFCEIYETRPQVCRDYLPGSSELCPLHSKYSIK